MTSPTEEGQGSRALVDVVQVAADLLDRVLLDLGTVLADEPRERSVRATAEVRGLLGWLVDHPQLDGEYRERYDAVRRKLALLADLLASVLGPGSWSGRVQGARAHLDQHQEQVVAALVARARAHRQDRSKPQRSRRFQASRGMPRLHRLPGADWLPFYLRIARAESAPQEQAQSDAEPAVAEDGPGLADGDRGAGSHEDLPQPPDVPPAPTAIGESRQVEQAVSALVLGIGTCWASRGSQPWHGWFEWTEARTEQQLLAHLDALVAQSGFGLRGRHRSDDPERAARWLPDGCDLPEVLARVAAESHLDPLRAFATTVVLGSIRGEEPVRIAAMKLRRSHPSTQAAHFDALALAPNPAIVSALETLCREQDARLVAGALEVMRRRREGRFGVISPLLSHPSSSVRRAAALALGYLGPQRAVAELLRDSLDDEVDDVVFAAIAQSLLRRDDARGLGAVRARLVEEQEVPGALDPRGRVAMMRLLALAGDAWDVEVLLSLARAPEEVEMVGWHGHVSAVPELLGILEEPAPLDFWGGYEDSRNWAAARALQRITGAMPEHGGSATGEQRVDQVTDDPQAWTSWWQEHGRDFAARARYRFGNPYAPQATIDELLRSGRARDQRELAELELGIVLPNCPANDPGDWLERQRAGLEQCRRRLDHFAVAQRRPWHALGQWIGGHLGKRLPAERDGDGADGSDVG